MVGGSSGGKDSNIIAGRPPNAPHTHFTAERYITDDMFNNAVRMLGSDDWYAADDEIRGTIKIDIVNQLTEKGINKKSAQILLDSWANSSNDDHPYSLALQKATSEEFSVDASDWQQTKFKENNIVFSEESLKDITRKIYENTQNYFTEQGYSPEQEVVLYRGVETKESFQRMEVVNWKGNILESWSIDPGIAASFGNVMVSIKIPLSSIWSTAITGPGCLTEGEFVIFGSIKHNVQVEKYTKKVYEDYYHK